MPVLFTVDLPTHDEVEARRLASIVEDLSCDTHGEVPTSVRLTSRTQGTRSITVRGCCPQLYLDVTDRLSQETDRPKPGTQSEAAAAETPKPRQRPLAL